MKIVAITACTVGIAHTYMAEANLKKHAEKLGYQIKVETQGSLGIENRLTEDDIVEADLVIIAADAKVTEMERFDNKKILEVSTSDVIHDVNKIFEDAKKLI